MMGNIISNFFMFLFMYRYIQHSFSAFPRRLNDFIERLGVRLVDNF